MRAVLALAILSLCALSHVVQAQLTFEKIDPANVPDNILAHFNETFTGATAIRWEKHTATANRTFTKYVAVFIEAGVHSRARYKDDGTPLASSKYYGPVKLPENIKTVAKRKYPDFTVMGGEEITTRNGKTYYRVRSRKGPNKLIQYFDGVGNELSKESAPEEVVEGEDEEGN